MFSCAWYSKEVHQRSYALQTHLSNCRRSLGGESPELAKALLKNGRYVPRWQQDMWSLGLLMLDLMCGQRPVDQRPILDSTAYIEATAQSQRLPAHLQYLADQLTDPVPYADKVQVTLKADTPRCSMRGCQHFCMQRSLQHHVQVKKHTIMSLKQKVLLLYAYK